MAGAQRGATSVEVYGFVGWIASFAAAVVFVLWAWVPDSMLQAVGVTYYPNKDWALILPAYLVVTVLCGYWTYESMNMMTVPPPHSLNTLLDGKSKWWTDIPGLASAAGSTAQRILPLVHMPPPLTSAVLYGGQHVKDAEAHLFRTVQASHQAGHSS